MGRARPWQTAFFNFRQGFGAKFDPGKSRFSTFASGSVRNPTLANCVFWSLPGVIRASAILAKTLFYRLPGSLHKFHLGKVAFLRQFMVIYLFSITAPPSPFPAALRLNCAANTVPSGAPPQPRRHPHSQRRSASTELRFAAHRVGSVTLRSLQEYSGCQDGATEYYRIKLPKRSVFRNESFE